MRHSVIRPRSTPKVTTLRLAVNAEAAVTCGYHTTAIEAPNPIAAKALTSAYDVLRNTAIGILALLTITHDIEGRPLRRRVQT
ncbi:hypothetical protein ACIBF6_43340 [Streptosporangium amethystogenes]|uniref:hypothetical protein n=1 Tax=Streptosporangium amethystogenes TaxID=2002 RepID=UPI00379485D8